MTVADHRSPYKFLDSYGFEDQRIFFGRDREIQILLSDVVLSRLVVLFAKTGTGKTSLINAGVRPELEERGYATFVVRVRGDPEASARDQLGRLLGEDALVGDSFARQLHGVVERLERPLVIFFDQFEEFFLYLVRQAPNMAEEFIRQVAEAYRDARSGVHMVFSMREDFYVEMDAFRDEIPTIFHNDSNLRLRWFDERQAREAIVRPAAELQVEVEPPLVRRLVDDLSRDGLIEPAQLQIVCDTLWRERTNSTITLDDYQALGRRESSATIAEQILSERLREQFQAFEEQHELTVVERLLAPGILSTPRGTKYVRDLPGLSRELDPILAPIGGEAILVRVLEQLQRTRLLQLYTRDDLMYAELTHDYLVADPERLAELRAAVAEIWPRRVLDRAHREWAAERAFTGRTDELEDVLERAAEDERNAREGIPGRSPMSLSFADALLLLNLALHRGLKLEAAFAIASARGVPAWDLVRETLLGTRLEAAGYAIDLLAELAAERRRAQPEPANSERASRAIELLLEATERDEIAASAIEALGKIDSEQAVDALLQTPAARSPGGEQRDAVESSLRRLARSRNGAVAQRARTGLDELAQTGGGGRRPFPTIHDEVADGHAIATPATALEAHYRTIADAILDARVVPLLGPDLNLSGRGPGESNEGSPPTDAELANRLAQEFDAPPELERDLTSIAQYIAVMTGTGPLYESLHELFAVNNAPTPVHRFLASISSSPALRTTTPRLPLIITLNYDQALERAFADAGEQIDVVSYLAEGESRGRFLHWPAGEQPRVIERPQEYMDLSLERHPVILKLRGTVDRTTEDWWWDSFSITEDHHREFLGRTDFPSRLPVTLMAKLRKSHLLFLGCRIQDRVFRYILGETLGEKMSYRSWAVQPAPTYLDTEWWRERGVEVLDLPLDRFAAVLAERVSGQRKDTRQ